MNWLPNFAVAALPITTSSLPPAMSPLRSSKPASPLLSISPNFPPTRNSPQSSATLLWSRPTARSTACRSCGDQILFCTTPPSFLSRPIPGPYCGIRNSAAKFPSGTNSQASIWPRRFSVTTSPIQISSTIFPTRNSKPPEKNFSSSSQTSANTGPPAANSPIFFKITKLFSLWAGRSTPRSFANSIFPSAKPYPRKTPPAGSTT